MGEAAERVGLPSYGAQADAAMNAGRDGRGVDMLVGVVRISKARLGMTWADRGVRFPRQNCEEGRAACV